MSVIDLNEKRKTPYDEASEGFAAMQAEEQRRRKRARTGASSSRTETEKKQDEDEEAGQPEPERRGRSRSRSRSRNRNPRDSRSRSRSRPPRLQEEQTPATNVETDLVVEDVSSSSSPRGLNPPVDSDLQQQQQPSNRNAFPGPPPILPNASQIFQEPAPASNPLGIQSGIIQERKQMLYGPPGSLNAAQLPPARGLNELKALQQQLEEINKTLEATKNSDAACQKALKEAKDALEACRKALEAPVQDLKKARELIKEKDRLINEHVKVSNAIAKERIQHKEKLDEYEEKLNAEKKQASTIAGERDKCTQALDECNESLKTERKKNADQKKELDDGFLNFQRLESKFNKQTERMELLEQELETAKEKKKGLAKELQAERKERAESVNDLNKKLSAAVEDKKRLENQLQAERKQVAEDAKEVEKIKEQIFWDILINTAYPKWQWEKLRRALKIKSKSITLEDVQARMKKEGWPLEIPEEAPSEQKVKKGEDPASKDLVIFSDMKDDAPQSRALVSVPQQLGAAMLDADECNQKLQEAEHKIEELVAALELCEQANQALETTVANHGLTITNLSNELAAKTGAIETARLREEAKQAELDNARRGEQTAQSRADANEAQKEEIERKYDELKARVEDVEVGVSLGDLAAQARAGATCEAKLQRALAEIDKLEKDLGDLPDEKDFKDLQDKFSIAIEQRNDAKANINRLKGELKECTEELTKCRKELEDCNEAKEHAEQRRGNTDRLYGNSITKRQELQRMVAFMDSFIKNLTERADDTDTKRLQERTEKQIAEARVELGEFKLEEVMRRVQRLVIQLRACEAEQVRLRELLRIAESEKGEAERRATQAGELKLSSQRQSREQILADANKKLNKTACNFIEDSLEFLIGGATGYINTGLPQRSEKKEAAMFYIHALCAEPHWAFLVARYLGKDYTMAYPLSEQIQLVLLDENENYEPESRSGRIHRSRNGWFSSSRRAKVIRVFDAFIVDMHYHRGMRQLRDIHRRPKDTMRSQDPGSFQLPDAAWVLKRVRFWNEENEKPLYSREDRMAITKEIIRAYQLFDLFDLDTSVPPVEIGWKAFMTDGDAQLDLAALITNMVHKQAGKGIGHELIWGTIRNNPSLLRYWRYEYPAPLVLLMPLWNYIMHVLDNTPEDSSLFQRQAITWLRGEHEMSVFFQYLPKLQQKLVRR